MTRRRILAALLLLAASLIGVISFWAREDSRRWISRVGRWLTRVLKPGLDASTPTGVLSQRQLDAVLGFAEILVSGSELPPHERQLLIEHIHDRTRNRRGYLGLYRTTAEVLDRLAAGSFSALDVPGRITVIRSRRLTPISPIELLVPSRRDLRAVRSLAIPDLIGAYYSSPAGWAVVGYAAFPGRCSSLARYPVPERSGLGG